MKTLPTVIALLAAILCAGSCRADDVRDRHGCIVRHNVGQRCIYPVFSADSLFEGGDYALDALAAAGVKGSFFFTGKFLRDTTMRRVIARAVDEGHYVGGHSDMHLLLCDWDARRTPLVTMDSLRLDLHRNLRELAAHGVDTTGVRWFLPPYEWADSACVDAYTRQGMTVVNITPGIRIYSDYLTPAERGYSSSAELLAQMWEFDSRAADGHGLDGAILIMHLGTEPARTDKLYYHLPEVLAELRRRGYTVCRLE